MLCLTCLAREPALPYGLQSICTHDTFTWLCNRVQVELSPSSSCTMLCTAELYWMQSGGTPLCSARRRPPRYTPLNSCGAPSHSSRTIALKTVPSSLHSSILQVTHLHHYPIIALLHAALWSRYTEQAVARMRQAGLTLPSEESLTTQWKPLTWW